MTEDRDDPTASDDLPATGPAAEGGESVLDLDGENTLELEETPPDSVEADVPTIPYDPDRVRAQVARALVVILGIVILFSFLTLWMISPTTADLEKLLTIIFGPLVALVSGAVGYYFGGKSDSP